MASPKPVIISPHALKELDAVYEYLLVKFGKSVVLKFDKKWKAFLVLISMQPRVFPYLNRTKTFASTHFITGTSSFTETGGTGLKLLLFSMHGRTVKN